MESNDAQSTHKNYLAGPDELQRLTTQFRSNLKERYSSPQKFVEIDGERKRLLYASITEVLDYAMEYTKMWIATPNEEKKLFKDIWFIDCRGLYVSNSPLDITNYAEHDNIQDLAPVQFDYSVINGCCLLFNKRIFLSYAHFFKTEFRGDVNFEQAQFNGEANFDHAVFSRDALFSECVFKSIKSSSFQKTTFSKRVDFSNTTFYRVPLFHETKLPQASSFNGAKFNKSGSGLSQQEIHQELIASRSLRQIAASYKGQQDEAMFFALDSDITVRFVWLCV